MKKVITIVIALGGSASLAAAADLPLITKAPVVTPAPSVFDVAFGTALMSDYNFRGISQSDRGMSVFGYVEPRWKISPNFELYAGVAGYSTKLPTAPTGEFDFYGGFRATMGPVTFDVGGIYYYYPNEKQQWTDFASIVTPTPTCGTSPNPVAAPTPLTVCNTDFGEAYGKVTWTMNDYITVGGYVYYSPNWLGSGADGTYAGGTAKLTGPSSWFPSDWGAYISGEAAHYWLGVTNATLGSVNLPDYTYWNIGVAFTYKVFTLDLRYHDTDLSRGQCALLTGDPRSVFNGGNSRWCSEAFIAKLSVDTTLAAIK